MIQARFSQFFQNKKLLLRLCCETAKHRAFLERLLSRPGGSTLLKSTAVRSNRNVALVLLYELVLGQGATRRSAPGKHEKPFFDAMRSVERLVRHDVRALAEQDVTPQSLASTSAAAALPRYARVNTLRATVDEALRRLEAEHGFRARHMSAEVPAKLYRRMVAEMAPADVFVDPHLADLLIFAPRTDLHDSAMVTDGTLVLQDKASCLATLSLRPDPLAGNTIDVCAAPGMKTSHLAALTQNKGKIFAIDRDQSRIKTLRATLKSCGARNVNVMNEDFLRLDVTEQRFNKIAFAIVDPPCSGSGMTRRGEFLDENETTDDKRLRSLANLQTMILKHTLLLPNLQRCVYSTCSVHDVENEGVVAEVLADEEIASRFELVDDLMPTWRHRGSKDYEFGAKCLRASPGDDLTNGFFVAGFQRKANEKE